MSGSTAHQSDASSKIVDLAIKRFSRVNGWVPIAVFAYMAGTQHRQALGVLLKVLVALGSEIP